MTTPPHPHTIGTIRHEGVTYEIDWPFDPVDDSPRDPYLGAIFRDGKEVGTVGPQGRGATFETEDDVMKAAYAAIMAGGTK